jgi:hypothetical protein
LRWWYANQKSWQHVDKAWETSMMIEALESHLVVPALREFDDSTSDEMKERFSKALEYAKSISRITSGNIRPRCQGPFGTIPLTFYGCSRQEAERHIYGTKRFMVISPIR